MATPVRDVVACARARYQHSSFCAFAVAWGRAACPVPALAGVGGAPVTATAPVAPPVALVASAGAAAPSAAASLGSRAPTTGHQAPVSAVTAGRAASPAVPLEPAQDLFATFGMVPTIKPTVRTDADAAAAKRSARLQADGLATVEDTAAWGVEDDI
jgi:hypothetical protein